MTVWAPLLIATSKSLATRMKLKNFLSLALLLRLITLSVSMNYQQVNAAALFPGILPIAEGRLNSMNHLAQNLTWVPASINLSKWGHHSLLVKRSSRKTSITSCIWAAPSQSIPQRINTPTRTSQKVCFSMIAPGKFAICQTQKAIILCKSITLTTCSLRASIATATIQTAWKPTR